ncbi:MAG: hypothetical protein JKY42_03980, partial [Flavobacteriales bacterium]|nr:hypothetical protein [Flavobacteriales bacterium]
MTIVLSGIIFVRIPTREHRATIATYYKTTTKARLTQVHSTDSTAIYKVYQLHNLAQATTSTLYLKRSDNTWKVIKEVE